MRVTSKGQVTIPQAMREATGILPETEVEFQVLKDGILIKKMPGNNLFGARLIQQMRGKSDLKMSTDQIMALTRE